MDDELDKIDTTQSSFWRDWKLKLEEQKRLADHSRVLEHIIPGVEITRFVSGDINYIQRSVFSVIESVKLEKKHLLKDVLKLADTYGLNHTKVLLEYLRSVLVSEVWAIDDITAEISEFKNEILGCAAEAIKTISLSVYPVINGHDKQRLAYVFGLLSDCYFQVDLSKELLPVLHPDPAQINIGLSSFYKVIEQECSRVSFIKNLDFKNIAGLNGLNFKFFTSEIYTHVDEYSVEALAKMVQTLVAIYRDPLPEDLISWKAVYIHHVLCLLKALEVRLKTETEFDRPEKLHDLISELEKIYDACRKYVRVIAYLDVLDIVRRFFRVIIPLNKFFEGLSNDLAWKDCLILLLNIWLRVIDDMLEFTNNESPEEKCNLQFLKCCLKVFMVLVMEGRVSPRQGWISVIGYVNHGLTDGFAADIFIFCRAMVFSECRFGAIAEVYSVAVSQLQNGSSLVTDTSESIQDLPHLYLSILETILQKLAAGSLEHPNLQHYMSSLSIMDGDLEELKRIRHAVWERMVKFSDNMMLPSDVRVYALELMRFISDPGRNVKGFSPELQSNVFPWEGWDDLRSIVTNNEITANRGVPSKTDASSRLTSTLVALKSSQLVGVISNSIQIRTDDLLSVDSAVSFFVRLCEVATSETHFDALLTILEEWEGLFMIKRDDSDSVEVADAANDWSNDGWDEGWESFQEEESVPKETKKDDSFSVHPLHLCWMEIFKKLVTLSRFRDLLKLIDQSNGVLLDQVGTHCLCQIVLGIDCFAALKLALLLPYEETHLQCLDAVEEKLKQGDISNTICKDHEFLILVLSSGLVSTIISRSAYGTTFSFLCYMVGNFSRQYQEAQLTGLKHRDRNRHENNEKDVLFLFRSVLFPGFVSELVKADQQILAGFIVTKFVHTNASLSLINIAEASLIRYLERQLQILQDEGFTHQDLGFGEPLVNTISHLNGRLEDLVQSALSSLRADVR